MVCSGWIRNIMELQIKKRMLLRTFVVVSMNIIIIIGITNVLFSQESNAETHTTTDTVSPGIKENIDTTANFDDEFIESELGEVIFSAQGDIYSFNDIVDNMLYKGMSLFFNARADTRYAIISSSSSIDTLLRLNIANISVYRDLYLGEDAGIVFTPKNDEQVVVTVFSTGKLNGTMLAKDVLAARTKQNDDISSNSTDAKSNSFMRAKSQVNNSTKNKDDVGANINSNNYYGKTVESVTDSLDSAIQGNNNVGDEVVSVLLENQKLGEYHIEIFQLPSNPVLVEVPYFTDGIFSDSDKVAHRVAQEYRIALDEGMRVYIRMESEEVDTLLEVSDRFGRAIISDDWTEGTSLLTFEVPNTDDFFVTASSFDGIRLGEYQLEIVVSDNEMVEEIKGQITSNSPKILRKYASEYPLNIKSGEYMTAVVQSLDSTIEVAFVNESLNAIHFETIKIGDTKIIPLHITQEGNYKLLMLSDTRFVSNYILTVYK